MAYAATERAAADSAAGRTTCVLPLPALLAPPMARMTEKLLSSGSFNPPPTNASFPAVSSPQPQLAPPLLVSVGTKHHQRLRQRLQRRLET